MKVRIMGKMECIQYSYKREVVPCAIISINEHGSPSYERQAPKLTNHENIKAVLPLFFDDIEPRHVLSGTQCKLMEYCDAEKIKSFVEEWKDQVEEIIVHCHAGISRSSAVASAVCVLLGIDDMWIWKGRYLPNRHVFETMSKVVAIPPEMIIERYAIRDARIVEREYGEIIDLADLLKD